MMGFIIDNFILFVFFIEVTVLCYIEYKAWNTLYTPLFFLMLPYTMVLIVAVLLAGNLQFVEFYYPSIIFWSVGLFIFALPSFGFSFLLNKCSMNIKTFVSTESLSPQIILLTICISILLIYKFYKTLGVSNGFVGSDEFADDFSGSGVWAHVRQITIPLFMLCVYFLNKKRWWLFFLIIVLLCINFVNQVKGTIVIAILGSLALRLYNNKTNFNLKLILFILLGGVLLFFISYAAMPLIGKGEGELTGELIEFVFKTFGHYFTSGIYGLSEDMQHNFPDSNSFEYIVAPLVNIYSQIIGDGEFISPVNPIYYHTGHSFTNVRTFFGTLYIYSNLFQFVLYTLFLSTLLYLLKMITLRFNNIFVYIILFYECSLLSMGWFEFYFFHLAALEIPILTLFLMYLNNLSMKQRNGGD